MQVVRPHISLSALKISTKTCKLHLAEAAVRRHRFVMLQRPSGCIFWGLDGCLQAVQGEVQALRNTIRGRLHTASSPSESGHTACLRPVWQLWEL